MNSSKFPDDEELEEMLRRLEPAPANPDFLARLQSSRPQPKSRRLRLWHVVPIAAAAAIAFAWIQPTTRSSSHPASTANQIKSPPDPAKTAETLQAVKSEQFLLDLEDLGVAHDPKQGPVRLIRTTWIDEISYAKPGADPEFSKSWIRSEIVSVSLPIL